MLAAPASITGPAKLYPQARSDGDGGTYDWMLSIFPNRPDSPPSFLLQDHPFPGKEPSYPKSGLTQEEPRTTSLHLPSRPLIAYLTVAKSILSKPSKI